MDADISGLVEALRRAGTEAQARANLRAQAAAARAAARLVSAYPSRSGRLRQDVSVRVRPGNAPNTEIGLVASRAPHAHLVEHGTRRRVDSTRRNANRGVMPAMGPIFVPIMMAERAQLWAEIRADLEQAREV